MQPIRVTLLVGILTLGAILAVSRPAAAPEDRVSLVSLRYPDLGSKIRAQRGRVVVVDFWADYCAPCKREFPKLVALHRKHAAAGLTAISVSLDDSTDPDTETRVRRFLSAQQATFSNFLLAEKPDVWQAKLKIDGPPCLFIFNRQGELVRKFHDDLDYAEVERLVESLLRR